MSWDGKEMIQLRNLMHGMSAYNDGNGIKYGIYFQPLLPPTPAGGKPPRKNARAEMINTNTFVHENSDFATTLDALIEALHYGPPLKFKIVGGNLRTTAFSVLYTIPRGKVRLDITELPTNQPTTGTQRGRDEEEEADPRKSKKRKLTEEEEAMAETITQLQDAHRCSDKACTSRFCFVGNPSASHVRLTPLHLKTWSAAILAKTPGVSADMPPGPNEEKMFWPAEAQSDDVDDIAMLAARRRSASAKPASTSSVTINNDFAGLAAIFQPFLTGAASASASHSQPQAPRSPSRPAPLPSTSASPLKPTQAVFTLACG
ncbi:hypothetical protein B0H11DRAFT_2228152 [Mycena galericulata]|nr:hypothetical protein B0H11DRAFT_2228152 [Mycena galericulata]